MCVCDKRNVPLDEQKKGTRHWTRRAHAGRGKTEPVAWPAAVTNLVEREREEREYGGDWIVNIKKVLALPLNSFLFPVPGFLCYLFVCFSWGNRNWIVHA